jgi:tetratricopeptide (TPR) repeat protein
MVAIRAEAAETPALKLLRNIQTLQAKHSFLAPELLPPLLELGQLYGTGQCDRAIEILDLALDVSRRHEGLFNPGLLDIYTPLLSCYITLDLPAALDRAQQYVVLIDEHRYGKHDPRLLPTLEQGAQRYEEVGLYLSARKLHRRALEIASRTAGENDLSLVKPLRGIARAFRLEYTYGLAVADYAHVTYEAPELVSSASFDPARTRLDRLGRRSLERAVEILRKHTDTHAGEYHDTLLELGDWHQLGDHRNSALKSYRELWKALHGGESPSDPRALLDTPQALLGGHAGNTRLRRPPADTDRLQKYTVDLDYAVSRDGRVRDVKVVESDAPKDVEMRIVRDFRQTRFRPRFASGEPVDTAELYHRQNFYKPRPATSTLAAR